MTLTRSAGILAFYGILAFLPKNLIRNQIRFFLFYPIFILSDSTARDTKCLVEILKLVLIQDSEIEILSRFVQDRVI